MRLQHITRIKKHFEERIHLDFIHLDFNDRLVDRNFDGTRDNQGQNMATFYILYVLKTDEAEYYTQCL